MGRIRTLLIANRGEIVLRIARSARALGIRTVAVFSASEANALHVGACDLALNIGGELPSESYLRGDKLIDAARHAGADAIHPGYGFLSENAEFAANVIESGLVWVGPPPAAIAAMGDKARARIRMAAAGVPVVPGYDGDDQTAERFAREAERIGFPVMVKASAGGGGRGMRLVARPEDLRSALQSASSEARKAFGDPRLILERAVSEPRHVELQVFADTKGNAVHLGERDCSVQRRHQKVLEEAPSPAVTSALRTEMGECAVRIAREIGYVGAGTVEFLLDKAGRYYFMEMNTRLQVEHPVTEAITGIDLVEWQLRIANGEQLQRRQADITFDGWAMEARLCAESPPDDYLPASGQVAAWSPPATARCDHAINVGAEVTPFFDSMLAKIVVKGETRKDACDKLVAALDETVFLGVASNRMLLARIARDSAFRDGSDVSTSFLAHRFGERASRTAIPDDDIWAIAAWLSTVAETTRWGTHRVWRDWTSARTFISPWRLQSAAAGEVLTRNGGVIPNQDGATVLEGGRTTRIEGIPAQAGEVFSATVGDRLFTVVHAWSGSDLWLQIRRAQEPDSADCCFSSLRRMASVTNSETTGREVLSPLNGRVVGVMVEVGAEVSRGQHLLSVEAMKMEHVIAAPIDARILQIHARAGDQVPARKVLIEFEALRSIAE